MKRLAAISITAGLAVAGCGGSGGQTVTQSQCAQWKAAAQTYALKYANDLPGTVSQATVQQLADSTYRVSAVGHDCP